MCMNPTRAATVIAAMAMLTLATSAAAWPFGGSAQSAAKSNSVPAAAQPQAPAPAPTKPTPAGDAKPSNVKATPQERAAAERLDPVARVGFWTREASLDPQDAEAGLALAQSLRVLGRNSEAVDAANQVLAVHPNLQAALIELARAEVSANRGFYAIRPLKLAAAANPRDWWPWMLLGVAYAQNEQPDLARSAYEEALHLAPNSPQALSNYALFRATHGEPQAAEAMLRKAVAAPGSAAPERQNLALVLGLQGKISEAELLIRQDLPPELADANLAYLRSLNAKAEPAPGRSWNAVQASEAAQIKAPS